MKLFNDRLSYLIPEARFNIHGRNLRNSETLDLYKCNTKPSKYSFFPTYINYFNLNKWPVIILVVFVFNILSVNIKYFTLSGAILYLK